MSATATKVGNLHAAVAEEIAVLLLRRRSNATRMAKELGWTQSYVSRRMAGDQAFDLDDLQQIANHLGIAVVDLLPRKAQEVTVWYSPEIDKAPAAVSTPSGAGYYRPDVKGVFMSPLPNGAIRHPPPGRRRTAPTGIG